MKITDIQPGQRFTIPSDTDLMIYLMHHDRNVVGTTKDGQTVPFSHDELLGLELCLRHQE